MRRTEAGERVKGATDSGAAPRMERGDARMDDRRCAGIARRCEMRKRQERGERSEKLGWVEAWPNGMPASKVGRGSISSPDPMEGTGAER